MKRNCVWALLLALAVSMLTACSSTEENVDAILTLLGVDSEEEYSEAEAEPETPFDETDVYAAIVASADESLGDTAHSFKFERDTKTLNLYIEAPEMTKEMLTMRSPTVMASWEELKESYGKLGQELWNLVVKAGGVDNVNIYMVDKMNSADRYDTDNYILWYEKGTLMYEYGAWSMGMGCAANCAAHPFLPGKKCEGSLDFSTYFNYNFNIKSLF